MGALSDQQRNLLDELLEKHGLHPVGHRFETVFKIPAPERPLTQRQVEVLVLVADGCTNAQIGKHLWITEETVKSHVRSLLAALGATSRAHAIAIAFRQGLIE